VAQRAGVSPQTVSRAINNKGEISPETRQRILAIAQEMGYRPNSIARGLKTNRTLTVGVVVPDIANPFFAEVVRGASEIAHSRHYGVLLCNTDERPEREWAILHMLEAHRVDGLLLISSRLSDERLHQAIETWQPIVLINRLQRPRPGVGYVLVNDAEAAFRAVRYLVSQGHRCIGFLGGSPKSRSGMERRQGYLKAMRTAGLTTEDSWCLPCSPDVEGGRQAALKLLSEHPEVTAILAYNDLVAFGVLQACRTLGRQVPKDCALLGWDDIIFASYATPPLSTMRMPKYQIGERAMTLLLDLMTRPESTPPPILLDAELILRESA